MPTPTHIEWTQEHTDTYICVARKEAHRRPPSTLLEHEALRYTLLEHEAFSYTDEARLRQLEYADTDTYILERQYIIGACRHIQWSPNE